MNLHKRKGTKEFEGVSGIGPGTIVIRLTAPCSKGERWEMEKELSEKFGRKVILLNPMFGEILTLPPEKEPGGSHGRP